MYPVNYRQIRRTIDPSTGINLLCKRQTRSLDKSPGSKYAMNMQLLGAWDVWGYGATPKDAYNKAYAYVRFQQRCIQNARFPLVLAHKILKAKKGARNGNL